MKYSVIGDEDAVLGFGMVGVSGKVVTNADEAARAFEAIINDNETSIIIITERAADLIRTTVDRYVFTATFPLIVEIPDRQGKIPGKPDIKEQVNAAIGIKL